MTKHKRVGEDKYHLVYGVIHPPAERDPTWTYNLHDSDIDACVKKRRHMPVYVGHGHKEGRPHCGWVTHLKRGPDGELMCTMLINSGVEEGRKAIQGMKDGTFKGLSLGLQNELDRRSLKVTHIGALEVSIATEGARPGTNIFWFQDESHKPIYSQFYKKKKMADELTQEEERLKKQLEELQQKKAAAAAGTALTAEEFLAKYGPQVAKLEQLAGGDIAGLATTLEQQQEIARQNILQEREAKRAKVSESIDGVAQAGMFGSDPETIKAEADRILDLAPTLVSSFADVRSNLNKVQSDLLTERQAREAKEQLIQAKDQEIKSLNEKLSKQQTIALATPSERFQVPKPAAPAQPAQTYQPQRGLVQTTRNQGIFSDAERYPEGIPNMKPASHQQQYIQRQATEQAIQQTAGLLASTPMPDPNWMKDAYAGDYAFDMRRM